MSVPSFPHDHKIVFLNNTAGNAVACDVVSMKNVLKLYFLIFHAGANDTDLVLTPTQATDVAAGTNKATSATHRIWVCSGASTTNDTWVEATAAAAYTIDPATQNPIAILIEVDPALHLDGANGYDCVYLADSGGHASNTVQIFAIAKMKDQGQAPLATSIIID